MTNLATPLSKFLDKFALFFLFYLLSFIFLLHYINGLILCAIISIITSSLLLLGFSVLSNKLSYANTQNKEKHTQINSTLLTLKHMSPSMLHIFFKDALKNNNYKLILPNSKKLIISHNNKTFYLTYNFYDNLTSFYKFQQELDYANKNNHHLIFLANNFEAEILTNYNSAPNISLLTGAETFTMLQQLNSLPKESTILKPQKKQKLILKNIFKRKNATIFLRFGLLFLLFSFITPLSTYYKMFCILFFSLSFICIFSKNQQNTNLNKNPLL